MRLSRVQRLNKLLLGGSTASRLAVRAALHNYKDTGGMSGLARWLPSLTYFVDTPAGTLAVVEGRTVLLNQTDVGDLEAVASAVMTELERACYEI